MRTIIAGYRAVQSKLSGIAALLGTRVSTGRFDPSPAQGRPPPIRIRAFAPDDITECREIYRLNEPNRFPTGVIGEFEKSTALPNCSFVVARSAENSIVGVAGIVIPEGVTFQSVSLLFGMVRPEMHRKGVGSALLLSRLCMLPPPDPYWRLTLAPVADSWTYYSRFGFQFFGRMKTAGQVFNVYQTLLYRSEWERCRTILDEAGVTGIQDLIDGRRANERSVAATRLGDGPA
jgi:hypothetical protein